MLARMWRKRKTPPLLVGLQAFTTTLEISLVVPQKIGHSTTGGSHNTSPGHISRRCPNRSLEQKLLKSRRRKSFFRVIPGSHGVVTR
ncbi:mCG15697 [Mus musculus]|nr:mCG15697 [Mus musculus]